ncbi:esterase-like activity of phytase family protein [Halovulum dunhuangense]|uniref:Esterase-like activity of phytase family protein n=1 Tax=Halovulum dunhuangense TaxID=1505036 RepID=A0A849L5E7_9RHOB|nr:esterase-like activity of phytase family protein [Halovulum dunhuangense]NNU81586.1 esterase-like activity of phytase family protein [Halovulum dunhuangense]
MRRHPALIAALAWLAAGCADAQPAPPALVQEAAITWRAGDRAVASLSGLALDPDGNRFVAVNDKGFFVTGQLERTEGRLTGVSLLASGPLLDPRGASVRRYDVDAEGVTLGPDGRLHISFEANHRVWAYADLAGPADPLPIPAAFRALQNNSGLEALFTGPDGAIHAIPERSGELDRPFPVYRFDGTRWDVAFTVPRRPPHLVTGADLGPDGRLYLLERHWNGLLSFSSRIRSFRINPDGLRDELILLESPLGTYDNLEGISVWRDPQGRIRVTVISDDNNSILQRTEIVEFRLDAPQPPRPILRGDTTPPTQ